MGVPSEGGEEGLSLRSWLAAIHGEDTLSASSSPATQTGIQSSDSKENKKDDGDEVREEKEESVDDEVVSKGESDELHKNQNEEVSKEENEELNDKNTEHADNESEDSKAKPTDGEKDEMNSKNEYSETSQQRDEYSREEVESVSSSAPVATSRMLLVGEDIGLPSPSNHTRDLMTWRLKDTNLLDKLTNRILVSSEDLEPVNPSRSGEWAAGEAKAEGSADEHLLSNSSQGESASKVSL